MAIAKKTTRKKTTVKSAVKKPALKATAKAKTGSKAKTITRRTQSDLVRKYRDHKADTGSIEVQAILFSEKINQLAKHLRKHHKDNDSKRGLLQMIGKRRRLLNYLKRRDKKKYDRLILDLGLRR
jgi:small subunit ribosomal protein S15